MHRRPLPLLALAILLAAGAARADEPHDFIAETRVLYHDVACGGVTEKPSSHCQDLLRLYERYRKRWLGPASAFLAKLVPAGLPKQVVYPFGGGDLLTALATFPEATEFTTISLEPAGDVRKARGRAAPEELALLRQNLSNLFSVAHSKTTNLSDEARGALPGQIVFTLAALALHGYEPTSLRYFRFQPDGTLAYLSDADIAAREKELAGKSPEARELRIFGDAEIRFRRAGDPAAPEKLLRHIAFNLDDQHLAADPSLIKHLEAKGKVTAMTKAASHLLWSDNFSTIRGYLLGHMAWMISDSTGIPPRFATAAGFVQDTYGIFEGPAAFGPTDYRDGKDLAALFKKHPSAKLPFRAYGYPDVKSNGHILVTRPQ